MFFLFPSIHQLGNTCSFAAVRLPLSEFPTAAVTNCLHRLGGLNNRVTLLTVLGARSQKLRCWQGRRKVLPKAPGRILLCLVQLWQHLAVLSLRQYHSNHSLRVHVAFISVSRVLFSSEDTCH